MMAMSPIVDRRAYIADRVRSAAARIGLPDRYLRSTREVAAIAAARLPPLGIEAAFSTATEIRYPGQILRVAAAHEADAFTAAAARGMACHAPANPKGIGRRAPSTPLDVALLIKTGALR